MDTICRTTISLLPVVPAAHCSIPREYLFSLLKSRKKPQKLPSELTHPFLQISQDGLSLKKELLDADINSRLDGFCIDCQHQCENMYFFGPEEKIF